MLKGGVWDRSQCAHSAIKLQYHFDESRRQTSSPKACQDSVRYGVATTFMLRDLRDLQKIQKMTHIVLLSAFVEKSLCFANVADPAGMQRSASSVCLHEGTMRTSNRSSSGPPTLNLNSKPEPESLGTFEP